MRLKRLRIMNTNTESDEEHMLLGLGTIHAVLLFLFDGVYCLERQGKYDLVWWWWWGAQNSRGRDGHSV